MSVHGSANNDYRLRLQMSPRLDVPRRSIWRRLWAVFW